MHNTLVLQEVVGVIYEKEFLTNRYPQELTRRIFLHFDIPQEERSSFPFLSLFMSQTVSTKLGV